MPAPAQPVNNPATHGKEGVLAIKLTSGATWTPVGSVSEWNLSRATDKVETTAIGDTNKRYVVGLMDVSGTFTAFFDRTDDLIFDAADSLTGCYIAIWPTVQSEQGWEGPAWLDASIKGGVTSAVTIDGAFVANGNWTRSSMVLATGATGVGSPGKFTPPGAMPPANLAAMTGITASPATAWGTGQYVVLGDGSAAHWNGTAWVSGVAAAVAAA